ncbi:hypothetical protein Glove_184g120 [Diversispora epigaea]|uniref:Uncharacterized protein n=1 Tax=Diversispora epigaea TaxID=1348612 RepID=A0A397IX24_9GLOM|nr:hypothetical protein Glove_184g120 [Diversispora epigaea]
MKNWKFENKKNYEYGIWSMCDKEMIGKLSCLPNVKEVFTIGTILAIELKDIGGSEIGTINHLSEVNRLTALTMINRLRFFFMNNNRLTV